jgi:hypothetical protein
MVVYVIDRSYFVPDRPPVVARRRSVGSDGERR